MEIEVRFTQDEVERIFTEAAQKAVGEPLGLRALSIRVNSYTGSTVTLTDKPEPTLKAS